MQDHEAKDAPDETPSLLSHSVVDLDLAERIRRALNATGYSPLRAIEVAVHDGQISLRGRVPSYFMKQIAQATVMAVPGVGELCNELDVIRPC
jgi:osmotically-inducible protein OsmY